jgi:hypothetical protein
VKQSNKALVGADFPMFHDQDAGFNFCFTFELLEAVLHEFGESDNKLIGTTEFIYPPQSSRTM